MVHTGEVEQKVGVPEGQGDRLQVIVHLFMFKIMTLVARKLHIFCSAIGHLRLVTPQDVTALT